MKRLLIVSRCNEPRGGADRIVADLCRELPRRGWQTRLALTQGRVFNNVDRYRSVYPDLPIVAVDGRLGTRHARCKALERAIRDEAPDIVLSVRVFDVHDVVSGMKRRCGGPRLAIGVRAFEAPYLVDLRQYGSGVDLCVTSGELIAAACHKFSGMPQERVVSVAGGVRLSEELASPRRQGNGLRLIYAGRLDCEQKRVLDLIPFTRGLMDAAIPFELDVLGDGPVRNELQEGLASLVRSGIVRFHGWQAREELYGRFFPQADVFVHFAAWEGVTIAPREAMVHGVVPVISQFIGQQCERQFVDGENSLTFPVGGIAAAVRCVARLYNEPGLLPRLSAGAIRSQTGKYTFEGAIDAWADPSPATADPPLPHVRPHRGLARGDNALGRHSHCRPTMFRASRDVRQRAA